MSDTKLQHDYQWGRFPETSAFIGRLLDDACDRNEFLDRLSQRMHSETGTRLVDWVDHLRLPLGHLVEDELDSRGYELRPSSGSLPVYAHQGGMFPALVATERSEIGVILRVDRIADFLLAHHLDPQQVAVQGDITSGCRLAIVNIAAGIEVGVIERHGLAEFSAGGGEVDANLLMKHREQLLLRPRQFEDRSAGFADLQARLESAIIDLGRDRACDLFFETERLFWASRNRAARVQLARQNELGLGWSNHDHHTYRSSRECFHLLIAQLERLGLECRERFYAGEQAGWGAQVLEHEACRIVVFADVDLSGSEVSGDFAHEPLPERTELGTVGLWCRLHGEAMLGAGMHHLECQFDFETARDQLNDAGIAVMKPFTDFPHLKQAFTAGEHWPVAESRLQALLEKGQVTTDEASRIRRVGAVGSHLEILMRDDGYRGFNQDGISDIILKTNPRLPGL